MSKQIAVLRHVPIHTVLSKSENVSQVFTEYNSVTQWAIARIQFKDGSSFNITRSKKTIQNWYLANNRVYVLSPVWDEHPDLMCKVNILKMLCSTQEVRDRI